MSDTNDNSLIYDYRVYYDDTGAVITYTMGELENSGNWMTITREQFAEANHNCKVIDGKLLRPVRNITYVTLTKSVDKGYKTARSDICILVDEDTEHNTWKTKFYDKSSRYT